MKYIMCENHTTVHGLLILTLPFFPPKNRVNPDFRVFMPNFPPKKRGKTLGIPFHQNVTICPTPNFLSPFSNQYLTIEWEEMPHQQPYRKAGLLQCPWILLTCFRARMSVSNPFSRPSLSDKLLTIRSRQVHELFLDSSYLHRCNPCNGATADYILMTNESLTLRPWMEIRQFWNRFSPNLRSMT